MPFRERDSKQLLCTLAGFKSSLEIVRIKATQPPGRPRKARWPNYKREILTSLFFLINPSPHVHTLKVWSIEVCYFIGWPHHLAVRPENAAMMRSDKMDFSSQRCFWFILIIHKNWCLLMSNHKMGGKQENAGEISKSPFSPVMEK